MFPKCHAGSWVMMRFDETGMNYHLEESELWTQGLFGGKNIKSETRISQLWDCQRMQLESLIRHVGTSH